MALVRRFVDHGRRLPLRQVVLGLVVGSLFGIGLRAGLFACAVVLFALFAGIIGPVMTLLPWADPVYTRAALHSLADITVGGVAVAGPPGDALHALFPSIVVPSARAQWSVIRVVLEPGSSVLGRLAAAGFTHAGVFGAALLLLTKGVQRRSALLISMSLAAQSQVALGLLAAPPALGDLETVGLSFAVNATLPWLGGRRLVLSDLVGGVPSAALAGMMVAAALVIAYLPAVLAAASAMVLKRHRSNSRAWNQASRVARRRPAIVVSTFSTGAVIALSAIAAACQVGSPLPAAAGQTVPARLPGRLHPSVDSGPEHLPRMQPPVAGALAVGAGRSDRWFQEATAPAHVEIDATGGQFHYLVNGQLEVIHGMGVNTQYRANLSPAERRARLDADLTEMNALGINTLVGWNPAEFDPVLLQLAQQHGIGVVMPFELRTDADYTDPVVRSALTREVLAWVNQYRHYPAVRMWGLGNEVLHKIVHPAWVGPQDPANERQAVAFSDWLVETADAMHAADPDHPVTYRDAEDAFVSWVADAMARHPRPRQTWFVWGTNCYQDYLGTLVDTWPDQGTGLALWVSEFAPGGVAIPDRPEQFQRMWDYVRRHPEWVLGGAVYAWTRNGPEEIDRNLGLTDDGTPADGRSLDAISGLFRTDVP